MPPEHVREPPPWPIAGCYRMRVAQLDSDYELKLPLGATPAGWLVMPPLKMNVLERLARLARVKIRQLEEIQTPAAWMREERQWWFCRTCLANNREDLTAPYWQRRWLKPEFNRCDQHPAELVSLSASRMGQCGNMRDVIHSVAAKMKKRDSVWLSTPH